MHSVELLFDERAGSALRRAWAALDGAGLPSQGRVRSASNRPHVTVAVAERIDPGADEAVAHLGGLLPLDCVVGAPLLFGGASLVLARLIVPTADLMRLQRRVFDACAPHMAPGPAPHTCPGRWTPHVTMGRRLRHDELPAALAVLAAHRGDLSGRFVGLRRWDGEARVEHRLIGPGLS